MELFIEYVKQYPILYNPEAKDYRDVNKKDGIWKIIVDEMKNPEIKDVKTAKNEWKKLRDGHRESLKRMKSFTSGQAAPLINVWKYASLLEFLLPYMKNRTSTGNINETQNNTSNTSVEAGNANESQDTITTTMKDQNTPTDSEYVSNTESIPSTSRDSLSSEQRQRKRKTNDKSLTGLKKEIDNDYEKRRREKDTRKHPLKLFFESMSETAVKFPDRLQRDVKKKGFNIIMEAEEKYETYLYENQYNYGYSTSSAQSSPHSLDPL